MNFKLTIDGQPLTLKLEAILDLFGRSRTMEFAEGKWAPFVFFELQEAANVVPEISHIEFFKNLTWDQISDALGALPRDVVDFTGFVQDEIRKIEAAVSSTPNDIATA
jgi:hypothetical protein